MAYPTIILVWQRKRQTSVPSSRVPFVVDGRFASSHGCSSTGLAAVDRPLAWTGYEAVPEWITGMGAGTTFPIG